MFRKLILEHLAKLELIMKTRQKRRSKSYQELLDEISPLYERLKVEALEQGRREGRREAQQEAQQEEHSIFLSRAVPLLLQVGMTIEQVAEQLQMDVEAVRQAAQNT